MLFRAEYFCKNKEKNTELGGDDTMLKLVWCGFIKKEASTFVNASV